MNSWIAAGLRLMFCLALVLGVGGCDNSTATFNADVMGCSKYTKDKKECIWSDVVGTYKVTVSKNGNSCAILYKKTDAGEPVFITGRHLTYIDNDNWQCTGAPSSSLERLAQQATMKDGEFTISLDPNDPTANEYIEATDGIVGNITHWYRLAHGTPCRGHLSKHSICDVVNP